MKPRRKKHDPLDDIKRELGEVRQQLLLASRKGDFRQTAQLNCRATQLRKQLIAAEGFESVVDL